MMLDRASGLLLHISSLPSPYGIGDLGPVAYRFVDLMVQSKQRWWQVLPVGPVGYGFSPYSGTSSFAGASLFISPELLVENGLLHTDDLLHVPAFPAGTVDYPRVIAWKSALLSKAFERFQKRPQPPDFASFCEKKAYWLDHYAAFYALGLRYGRPWIQWPAVYRSDPLAGFHHARKHLAHQWESARFRQYVFDKQWHRLRAYCHDRGVQLIGDMPIYVSHDSADVWNAQNQFQLDTRGNPVKVGGVPPDFFSATGQRWGNPLYRWDIMEAQGFGWWQDRLRRACELFDIIRLDHFRGFAGYWEIPASEETAVRGRWVKGPGTCLFDQLTRVAPSLPFIAEDLGVITDDVRMLMHTLGVPGMAVLQFAFDGDASNPYLPHNYPEQIVAYTGTHDNDTLMGWLKSTSEVEKGFCKEYLGLSPGQEHWQAIDTLMASRARTIITPIQDILGLDSEARMNTPGTVGDNWRWRMHPKDMDVLQMLLETNLRKLTLKHGREPARP